MKAQEAIRAEVHADKVAADLPLARTCDLVNELVRREGVTEIICPDPSSAFCVAVDRHDGIELTPPSGRGPARILVVID